MRCGALTCHMYNVKNMLFYLMQVILLVFVEILVFLCMVSVLEKSLQWATSSALAVSLATC